MDVNIHEHGGEIIPKVVFYQKNPDDDNDHDLWVVTFRQDNNTFSIYLRDYKKLHNLATVLMTEAASVRP